MRTRYITKTSGPGAYQLGDYEGKSMGYHGVGMLPVWLGGSGGVTTPGGETVVPENNVDFFGGIANYFKDAGQAVSNVVSSTGWGVSSAADSWQNAPVSQSTGSQVIGAVKDVATSILGNLLGPKQTTPVVVAAPATNYMPYVLIGGAALAAFVILKKRKK